MLNTVPQALSLDVPQFTLHEGDKICRHPDDGAEVSWRITSLGADGHDRLVVHYTHPDGADTYTFHDPDQWVRVEVGMVLR